jgi:hypothetical protein
MKAFTIALLALGIAGCASAPPDEPTGQPAGPTVVVCHKGKKTMELPEEAVEAHLNHGDRLGPC